MPEFPEKCEKAKKALLEAALAGEPEEQVPPKVQEHLNQCDDCRLYWEGVRISERWLPAGPLYGPSLKHRTLAAVDEALAHSDLKVALLVAPLALFVTVICFVVPTWIVSLLITDASQATLGSVALSFFIVHTAGAAAAGLCTAALLRRWVLGIGYQEVFHE